MSEALTFLAAPMAMCFILAGIHCYLGLHVLARGVIFVDLSLAQVAAFGATVALLVGFEHDGAGSYLISLGSTLVAAAFFAIARRREKQFSQEAVIGIVYALTSAAVVLVVDHMAHGAEHIKDVLVGQILWVTWPAVGKTAAIYALVGLIHYVWRRPLLAASFDTSIEVRPGWDFLFYALFGIIITSSVRFAGVLMVFAYLIVPAMVSALFRSTIRGRLVFGWIFGAVVSIVGMALSYVLDLPSGALIVTLFTAVPLGLLIAWPKEARV
jgi:zinc/manganese transport system permease protein